MKHIFELMRGLVPVVAAGFISLGSTDVSHASDATAAPKVFCDDPATLLASKTALAAGDVTLKPALARLLAEADKRLKQKAVSVMDKNQVPPSGDKHDFISQAPYFWRDTNSPDGKYIRKDGERNPESNNDSDSGRFQKTCADVHTLALAYYLSGDEKYAAKAAELVRVWFLDPATHMNPNLNYGQGIPGEVEGRPAGLISARGLVHLVDAIGLIAGSKAWTADDQKNMTAWFTDYLHWLTTSKVGRGELGAKNNHGTYCDTQAASIALFLGKTDVASNIVAEAKEKRVTRQITPDGREPMELARTTSFGYSTFNLRALMDLASIGRAAGVDLWHFQTADGRSILKATEFMAPYVDPGHKWPYQQIHPANQNDLAELLFRAAAEFPDSQPVKDALKSVKADGGNPARLYLKVAVN
ncbi:MAG TPA: alginate lyase family protein [Verrucomicrobiae bacterium]|nr:alginate lyase family protein [Verrucomicrobiae bacterium]